MVGHTDGTDLIGATAARVGVPKQGIIVAALWMFGRLDLKDKRAAILKYLTDEVAEEVRDEP